MGFRSNGCLAIDRDAWTVVKGLIALGDRKMPELIEKSCDIREAANGTFIDFSYLKMYESYPDVQEFYAFMDWMDEFESNGITEYPPYHYIEVDEDNGITSRGDNYELIYTTNVIEEY